MEITKRVTDSALVVDVVGKLDTQTAGSAMDQLQQYLGVDKGNLLINLSGLDFVSSSGLRVILRAAKQVRTGVVLREDDVADRPRIRPVRARRRVHHVCVVAGHPADKSGGCPATTQT